MSVTRRDDILNAVYEADRLHKEFETRSRTQSGDGRVDVFGMIVKREIPVMFRPLKKLLGAFISDPSKGIILTSSRPLPVQRFTAAHELGHAVLGHEASYDEEEILARALFAKGRYDRREIQANAFASRLLTPSWLVVQHMERQGWTRDDLRDPVTVYQLSLRMGSSYAATCYALEESKAISQGTRAKLLDVQPRAIKQELAAPYKPETWYGDVWLVTDRDNGMVLEGSRSDLVVLRFEEHASSGYVWQFGDLASAGLAVKEDGHTSTAQSDRIGGVVYRKVVTQSQPDVGASGHLHLREVRPWQLSQDALRSLDLEVDLSGPLPAGLLPEQREALLTAA